MKRRLRIGIIFCLTAALSLTAGCGAIAEKATRGAVEKATGVKVDDESGKVTVTGKDGKQSTFSAEEGKLPEDLPADFPVHEGAKDAAGVAETETETSFTFRIITKATVKDAHAWYQEQLKAKGWTEEYPSPVEDGAQQALLSAKKEPSSQVVITASSEADKPGQTSIMVMLTVKK